MRSFLYKIFACFAISFLLNYSGSYASVYYIDDISSESFQDSSVLKTLYDSARFYAKTDPVLSKSLLQKLISISRVQDSSRLFDYYTLYGNACLVNGDFMEAEQYYQKSLAINLQRKDTLEQVRVLNNLSYLHLLSGRLDLSIRNSHDGLRLLETMSHSGSLPDKVPQFGNKPSALVQSFFYNNIGQINMKVGNYNDALNYFKKTLSCVNRSKDKIYIASALNDIASAYRHLKQYDQALVYCQKAVAINKEIDNDYGIGLNYQMMGDIYANTKNLGNANALLKEGMEILGKSNDITAQSRTLLSIVGLNIKSKQLENAQKNLDQCFKMTKDSPDLEILSLYYYYQFKLDSIQGSLHKALSSYIKYHELNGQVIDVKMSQRITEIQTAFEMQRKDQENKLLKSENEIQKMRIDKARIAILVLCGFFSLIFVITLLIMRHQRLLTKHKIIELKQKNLNQQMNPHFVYNCLTSIQSFILHNDISNSLEYLSKFSKLMRKILESSQNQYMSVKDEIEILNLYLKLEAIRFKGKFVYEITVDEKIDPILFKIPSLLIQPFVENSIWHGLQNKEGKGVINVAFHLSDKSIFCTIEDNGVGREHAEMLKRRQAGSHISLGSSITQARIKLLKSLYGNKLGIQYVDLKDFDDKPAGTRVELFLPILN
jgi:tetratricopeptide (TPR) repeat protein